MRLTAAIVGLLCAHGALAAPPSPTPGGQAEVLCSRGRAEMESAYRRSPSQSLLCELARCARSDKNDVAAIDLYHRCLAEPRVGVSAALVREATAAQTELPADVGELLLSGPSGAVVFVDERLVGMMPFPDRLLLRPGDHRITIEQGSTRISSRVRIRPGQGPRVSVVGQELQQSEPFSVLVLPTVLPRGALGTDEFLSPIEDALLRAKGEPLRRSFRSRVLSNGVGARCDRACQLQLGSRAESLYVLSTEVTGEPADGHRVRARLLDVRVQRESAQKDAACPGCSSAQLAQMLAQLSEQVMREGQRPSGSLSIASIPPAQVELDRESLGSTPLRELPVFAGDHQLRLQRRFFLPIESNVQVDEGRTKQLSFALQPSPRTRAERFAQVGKWVFGTAGVVALGAGAALVARGTIVSDSYAPTDGSSNEFRIEYALTPAGYGLIGAGGGALLTGIALAIFDNYGQRQRRVK